MGTQQAKEKASVLAAQRGLSLFTRGHQVLAAMSNGRTRVLCGSHVSSEIWPKAVQVLLQERGSQNHGSFRLVCPNGLFVADSMAGLLWHWLAGRSEPFHVSDEG